MKKSLSYVTLLAGTAFTILSCQKINDASDGEAGYKKKHKKDLCFINSFSYSNSRVPTQTIFNNHFDLSGRSIEVEAGLYSGGSVLSSALLSVKWTTNGIAFVDANAPQDTILLASFDSKGRIDKITAGNKPNPQFLPTTFEYDRGDLSAMHITLAGQTEISYFDYDQKGNLLSITDAPTPSVPVPGKVEYKYATSETANDQLYLDEPRKFSWNSFTLLQYIGLFPELHPVNLRTSTRVTWGNNYQAYNMDIANQQLDAQGKLISYDVVSPGSNTAINHYNINWSCNGADNLLTKGIE